MISSGLTKYGIDLIDEYPQIRRTKIITDIDWRVTNIPPGALIIYNPDVVNELKLQGYNFPLFAELYRSEFKLLDVIGGYEIYKKLVDANEIRN